MFLLTTASQRSPLTLPRPVSLTSRWTWKLGQTFFFLPSESVCGSKPQSKTETRENRTFLLKGDFKQEAAPPPPIHPPFSFHINKVVCDPLINLGLI